MQSLLLSSVGKISITSTCCIPSPAGWYQNREDRWHEWWIALSWRSRLHTPTKWLYSLQLYPQWGGKVGSPTPFENQGGGPETASWQPPQDREVDDQWPPDSSSRGCLPCSWEGHRAFVWDLGQTAVDLVLMAYVGTSMAELFPDKHLPNGAFPLFLYLSAASPQ